MNTRYTLLFIISCLLGSSSLQAQNYLMDGTPITTCSGFFQDSGGGNGNYSPNESFTTTICSDMSSGTHIRLVFANVGIEPGDFLCFYDGTDINAPLLSCHDDFDAGSSFIIQATAANTSGCLTITFNSDAGATAAGWSAPISCVPACQTIQAVLTGTTPAVMPADTGWIDICPGDVVFFNGQGLYPQDGIVYNHSDLTSDFEWDFGDGTFGLGLTPTHVYNDPGGYVVQLTITDQFGCRNTNFISQRVRVAPPPSFDLGLGLVPQICAGDTVNLNALINDTDSTYQVSVSPNEGSFLVEGIRSDSLALPDGTGIAYEAPISFYEFSPGQVLTDIDDLLGICVNIEHSYMRDLEISITCPNGTSIILHDHPGPIPGEVFLGEPFVADEGLPVPIPGVGYDYCWTPDATNGTWIQYANTFNPQTLPPGDYSSFQPLENLLGCPLNGEWTLSVEDLWAADNGYIFSWTIAFNPDLYPNVETFTPQFVDWGWLNQPSIFFQTQDSISAAPQNAGQANFTFQVTDSFGCTWESSLGTDVLPFTHPNCFTCEESLTPAPDTSICVGEQVTVDVSSPIATEFSVGFESFPDYAIGFGNHPPGSPYAATINVNSIFPLTITNPLLDIESVCLDLETDFLADIRVFLRAPNGAVMELTTNNGGASDFYANTCFSPDATVPITAGTTPFTGNYIPEGDWNILNGAPVNGNWALLVSDAFGPTTFGTLNQWSINFRATNNVNYNWDFAPGLSCFNCPTPTLTPAVSTSYVVNAQDQYNCLSTDTIQVTVLEDIPAPVLNCDPILGNGAIEFSWDQIAGFSDYEINVNNSGWITPNNGNLSHIVSGLNSGDFVTVQVQVAITDPACSIESATLECLYFFCGLESELLPANIQDPSCVGVCDGSILATATTNTGGISFTLNHPNYTLTQPDGNFTGLCPGDHQLIITDAQGCLDTIDFTLNPAQSINVNIVQTQAISCAGEDDGEAMAMASGGTGIYTYQWDDPLAQFLQTAIMLSAGPLSVTVTDSNGCEASTTVQITEPAPLQISMSSTDILCFGQTNGTATATVSGGTGAYNYLWDNPGASQTATVNSLAAGNYQVVVTDANGCQIDGGVTIDEPATALSISASQTQISCFNEQNSAAEVIATGGTPNYSYLWSNAGNQAGISGLPPGTYSVTVADSNGCTETTTVNVVQYDPIDLLMIFVPPTCNGVPDGAMAVNNVNGGSGGLLSYEWNTTPPQFTDIVMGLTGGQNYTVTVTDDAGCQGTESLFLPQPPPLIISTASEDVLCFGEASGTASVTNVQNAIGNVSYAWSGSASGQTTAAVSGLLPGTYTVTVTDDNGCEATESVLIGQPPLMELNFSTVQNDCFGETDGAAQVQVSGGSAPFNYQWSNGGNGPSIGDLAAGVYSVTVTDANGCVRIDSSEILQPELLSPLVTASPTRCAGERNGSITIEPQGGTGPFLFSLNGETYSSASTFVGLTADTYTVFIQDFEGCTWLEQVTVEEPLPMEVIIVQAPLVNINLGESINLFAYSQNATGPVSFTWNAPYEGTLSCTNCFETTSTPESTITYEVEAVDSVGCRATERVQVRVIKDRVVLVPTGFSPNGDGNNDRLLVHGQNGTIVNLFQVFDRWGELLYQATDFNINDPQTGWDGSFRGQTMNSGVFMWYVEVTYIDGERQAFKGTTTLVR